MNIQTQENIYKPTYFLILVAGLQASRSNLTAATEMGNDLVSTQMELAEYTGSQKKINWFAYCGARC